MVPRRDSQPGLPSLTSSGGLRPRPSQPPAWTLTRLDRGSIGNRSPRRVDIAKRRYAAALPCFYAAQLPSQSSRVPRRRSTPPECMATNPHDTNEGLGAGGTRATRKVTAGMHPERRGLRHHVASSVSLEQAKLRRNTCRTGLPLTLLHSSVLALHAGAWRSAPRQHSGSAR